jgi:hypothetical protein
VDLVTPDFSTVSASGPLLGTVDEQPACMLSDKTTAAPTTGFNIPVNRLVFITI